MKPRITRAPKKATAKPVAVKAPTAKPKLILRPKPKSTPKPAANPASTNGPLHQIPPESPDPPPTEIVEPVIQSKPLIITIPPENPAPSVSEAPASPVTEGTTKPANYLVIESEVKEVSQASDVAVTDGYTVVESETADMVTPPIPSVPMVTIPPNHAIENVSSLQLGDVLIIAVKVQPAPAQEVEP
jgi:hypothetical protein